MFKNLTKTERAWVLYDVGNSAFTMLACSLIPIWFKDLAIGTAPGQITSDQATAYYSIAISVVTVIVAVLGPVCGAFADHRGRKPVQQILHHIVGTIGRLARRRCIQDFLIPHLLSQYASVAPMIDLGCSGHDHPDLRSGTFLKSPSHGYDEEKTVRQGSKPDCTGGSHSDFPGI